MNNTSFSDDTGAPVRIVMADIRERLAPKYGAGEAREMARMIFENLKGWSPVDLAIRQDEPVSVYIAGKIDSVVNRLLDDEPIQQIFGIADFYGMKLKVTPDTLIPRQETAELVDLIVKENDRKDLRVLDAGTGSGCIAIALSRNLPFSEVTAIDISDKALEVARVNARALHCAIDFRQADMLSLPAGIEQETFDIIVSNPPYVTMKEKEAMERNVLEYEPATALFIPDSDPLKFYLAILRAAQGEMLRPGGRIYFEINPAYADNLLAQTIGLGFRNVTLTRDTYGKQRFLSAQKADF